MRSAELGRLSDRMCSLAKYPFEPATLALDSTCGRLNCALMADKALIGERFQSNRSLHDYLHSFTPAECKPLSSRSMQVGHVGLESAGRKAREVQVPPPAPSFHASHARKQRADGPASVPWDCNHALVTPHRQGTSAYPESFCSRSGIVLNAIGMMAPESIGMRAAKTQENKYENTDGPDIP